MKMKLAGLVAGCLLVAACPSPIGPDGPFTAELAGDAVTLRNGTDERVWYAAIGHESLVLFAPCVRPDCPSLESGAEVAIPMGEIPAGATSDTIAVHWWTARGSGGDRAPGPVRTIRLVR